MSNETEWLDLEAIKQIHRYQIERFGGCDGICDFTLLESAVYAPQSTFDGKLLYPSVYEQSAAYLYHLVQNHPFLDGNKRTGAMAAVVFLDINGYEFAADENDFTAMVLSVASGTMKQTEIVSFLRENTILR